MGWRKLVNTSPGKYESLPQIFLRKFYYTPKFWSKTYENSLICLSDNIITLLTQTIVAEKFSILYIA